MSWALLVANIGLVIATVGLVIFTKRMADEAALTRGEMERARAEMVAAREEAVRTREEMTEARALSVRPRLAFDVMVLGGKVGLLLIRNVGNGVALQVNLKITFGGAHPEVRTWSEPSFAPSESHELKLPDFALRDVGSLAEYEMRIQVEGSMRNLDGEEIPVEEDFDTSDWWRNVVEAKERIAGRRKLPGVDPTSWGLVQSDD
jgi:hypothetical protein